MRRVFAAAIVFAGLAVASPAISCSIIFPADYSGSARERRDVRESIEQATVIVDGEVVRPWTKDQPALVRVEHVLKGDPPNFIEVGGSDAGADCSLALDRLGERRRMILSNGPKPYDLFADGSQSRLEDRILRSDRRKVWPYRSGNETEH